MNIPLLPEILAHLKARIYLAKISLPHWLIADEVTLDPTTKDILASRRLVRMDSFGGGSNNCKPYFVTQPFGGYDKTVWFKNEISIPRAFVGKPVVFVADFTEALVFVNGEPFQGIDTNHQEVLLTKQAKSGETFHIDVQAYSGRKKQSSSLNTAFVAVLNTDARSVFNGLTALKDLHDLLEEHSVEAKEVRKQIQNILSSFNGISPDSAVFDKAIQAANNSFHNSANLQSTIRTPQSQIHLVAHSHIDIVWLWTLKETKRKCARTFSTMLRLMEEFPEFTFTQSQALLYEFVKTQYPDIYRQIKHRIQEGRWHPVGAMWVEPDCNIPNGESLVRQILYGKKFFKAEFGIDSDTLWLPDTFGYSWALPQILLNTGIKHFFTTKLSWNDTTTFPHTTFWWRGIDGSQVLAHLPPVGLEGTVEPKHHLKSANEHKEREQSPFVMQTFGYGDGGGGPTKQQVEAARALGRGLLNVKLSTVREFFTMVENVERRAKSKSTKLPVWSDELYLELHRGTYTTHGWIKKANRDAERLLYETELLCSLAMVSVQQYPTHEIETTWKKLLLNQFHDIVPGTAIADAYVDARKGFDEIGATCASLKAKALSCFVQAQGKAIRSPRSEVRERRFVVFNTQCFARSEYLLIRFQSKAKRFLVLDEQSRIIKSQFISSAKGEVELLCYIEDIGPFSSKQLNVYEQKGAAIPTVNERWQKKRFQSSFYRVQFGADGTIISLYDKILKRELIAKGKRANELQTFKDAPKLWDAWEIDPNYQQQQLGRLGFVRAEVVELGSLRAVIRVEHESKSQKQRAKSKGLRGGTPSMISQDIVFYHASRRIDFVTKVNWHEERTLLKVAFPLNVKTDKATYETQFGALARTSNPKSKADRAKYEVPAQQWADMSERKFGVSLLNDCKYGYDASGDTLRLTLIRSPHYPHPQEPWWLTDEAVTDQGIHTFTYSLYPHAGDWRDAATTQRARELNNPLIVVEGETKNKLPSLLSISHPNIIVDSVKKAEEGNAIVVRLHEAHGKKTKATIQFASQPIAIEETDLLENRTHKLTTRNSKLETQFKPFEIKTLKLKP